jgi:anti-sigma B factor antagonist
MKITREDRGGIVVLRLDGSLIGGEAEGESLSKAVQDVTEGGSWRILMDLTGVPFINSMGLGFLVVNFVRLRRESGDLKLLNPSGRVKALMETVPHLFEIFFDEKEALESFQ